MDIELLLQVWKELKQHIISIDVDRAAEDFVHVLIEHGVDAEDILEYAIDKELKHALAEYVEIEHDEDDDEDDELMFG